MEKAVTCDRRCRFVHRNVGHNHSGITPSCREKGCGCSEWLVAGMV